MPAVRVRSASSQKETAVSALAQRAVEQENPRLVVKRPGHQLRQFLQRDGIALRVGQVGKASTNAPAILIDDDLAILLGEGANIRIGQNIQHVRSGRTS